MRESGGAGGAGRKAQCIAIPLTLCDDRCWDQGRMSACVDWWSHYHLHQLSHKKVLAYIPVCHI